MWRGGEQKWGEMEDANPQTSKGTRKGFTRKGLGVLLGPVSGDRFPGKEGSISVGPGWLGRILQAERDGNVDSRQSKSASSWQVAAASVQSGAACGCFWRGCEAGKLARVRGRSRAQGQGHPSTPLPREAFEGLLIFK